MRSGVSRELRHLERRWRRCRCAQRTKLRPTMGGGGNHRRAAGVWSRSARRAAGGGRARARARASAGAHVRQYRARQRRFRRAQSSPRRGAAAGASRRRLPSRRRTPQTRGALHRAPAIRLPSWAPAPATAAARALRTGVACHGAPAACCALLLERAPGVAALKRPARLAGGAPAIVARRSCPRSIVARISASRLPRDELERAGPCVCAVRRSPRCGRSLASCTRLTPLPAGRLCARK